MKYLFLFLSFLMLSLTMSAQNMHIWSYSEVKADELKGTSAYTMYCFTDGNGIFTFDDLKNDKFSISTNEGIFSTMISNSYLTVLFGLYDENDVLLEKINLDLERPIAMHNLLFAYGGLSRKSSYKAKAVKILDYIKNGSGYVRIIASRYLDNDFEFKVPCLTENERTKMILVPQ